MCNQVVIAICLECKREFQKLFSDTVCGDCSLLARGTERIEETESLSKWYKPSTWGQSRVAVTWDSSSARERVRASKATALKAVRA